MIPSLSNQDALFLDFDGTLVDIAPRPEAVAVPTGLPALLGQLQDKLDGAVAIISGRPVAEIDHLLQPLQLLAAGEHGAELRYSVAGEIQRSALLPAHIVEGIRQLGAALPGTQVEIKGAAAALHYRNAPEHGEAVLAGMQRVVSAAAGYELLQGKMVAELKRADINKGLAVSELMTHPPFPGRRPVYIGDDVTDEAGFRVVNEAGGLSVRVGMPLLQGQQTHARYALDAVADVYGWLNNIN